VKLIKQHLGQNLVNHLTLRIMWTVP